MKTTFTITVPELKAVTRALSSDWGPTLHATARSIGAMVALAWTVCSLATGRWRQMTAWVQAHHLQGLSRLGLPGGIIAPRGDVDVARGVIVQRQAAAIAPANIAPPTLVHISDPMARAVRLVRDGKSQRLAASLCGVSRTSLQRALKR